MATTKKNNLLKGEDPESAINRKYCESVKGIAPVKKAGANAGKTVRKPAAKKK